MKKFLRYALVAAVAFTSSAIAKAEEPTDSIVFAVDTVVDGKTQKINVWNLPLKADNAKVGEYTYNGMTIKLNATTTFYYNPDGYLMLGKKNSTITLPAFDYAVGRIEVEGTSGASAAVGQNIYVGDEAVSTPTTGAKNVTNVYDIAAGYQAAGTIYSLMVTTDHNTQIKKIYIYKYDANVKLNPGLAWSTNKVQVEQGAEFEAPTFSKVTTATATFTSDNEEVATVDANGVITLAGGIGTAVITASVEANDEYEAGSVSCTIQVFNYVTYKKATTLTAGAEYILCAQRDEATMYAIPLDANKTYGYLNATTIEGLVDEINIKSIYNDGFVIDDYDDGYSIKDAEGRYYVQEGNYNSFQTTTEEPTNAWSITANEDGTFDIEMNGYLMQWGSGTYKTFALYQGLQENAVKIMLYEKETTGIQNVAAEVEDTDAPVVYYNLQGVQVKNPSNGIYIRVQGKKATKIAF